MTSWYDPCRTWHTTTSPYRYCTSITAACATHKNQFRGRSEPISDACSNTRHKSIQPSTCNNTDDSYVRQRICRHDLVQEASSEWVSTGFTSHSTRYKSFQRRVSGQLIALIINDNYTITQRNILQTDNENTNRGLRQSDRDWKQYFYKRRLLEKSTVYNL